MIFESKKAAQKLDNIGTKCPQVNNTVTIKRLLSSQFLRQIIRKFFSLNP